MIFEDELEKVIRDEMTRMQENAMSGNLDIRSYDRLVGGYHALRLVIEEMSPEVRKKLNE
jgi:hypothetical protein